MKRILALGLALLLVVSLLPTSVLAEQTAPAFVVSGGKADKGETVDVTISVVNNPGIVSAKVLVAFDANVLALTAVEEKDFPEVSFGPLTKNPVTVNFMDSIHQNNTTNGVLAVLTFEVLDTAAYGETLVTATYNPNDVFDYDYNNVAFDVVDGWVTIGCTHKETTTVAPQPSTCLTQGHGEYTYCNKCNQVVSGSDALLPLGDHDVTAQVVADQYKVSDATCQDVAVYRHSCVLCGVAGETTFTAGEVDLTNHCGTIVEVLAQPSTCLTQGHGAYSYCDQCNLVVAGSKELLPLADHKMDALVEKDEYLKSPATCNTAPIYYYSCSICGEKGDETFAGSGTIDRTNHEGKEILNNQQDPTYDAPGYTGDVICDACGTVLVPGEVIPALQRPSGLQKDGDVYRYVLDGQAQSGWFEIDGAWYYFFEDTLSAKEGSYKVGVVTYTFEETGKLVAGVWGKTVFGTRYYYGPDYYRNGWLKVEGNAYYFQDGYRYEGIRLVKDGTLRWFDFGTDGICSDVSVEDGFYTDAGGYGYCQNGLALVGTQCIDGFYYYFNDQGYALKNGTYDGRLYQDEFTAYSGGLQQNDIDYLYKDGKAAPTGLYQILGDYYYVGWDGSMQTNGRYYTDATFCDLPIGNYTFGADGKMLQGMVAMDGAVYLYKNGNKAAAGLYQVDGGYYFVGWDGAIKTNDRYYVETTYCDLPANANYTFGADGKMLNGIAQVDGVNYLYVNGTTATYGLFKINGDYYFADWGGIMKANGRYYVDTTFCDLPANQNYTFGADGKMLNGIVEVNGTLYYYVNGTTATYGMVKVDGDYYLVDWGGVIKTDGRYYVDTSFCDLPANQNYSFGADGKMLNGVVEVNGTLYYYINGTTSTYGLFNIDGDYYYVNWGGIVMTDGRYYVDTTHCDLPANNYTFGADGKMLNGVVEVNGTLYYYINGTTSTYGLFNIDGDYYFAGWGGVIQTDGRYYVDTTFCDLPAATYTFGADGKMAQGFVHDGDVTYYYVNGNHPAPGVILVDGDYYFVNWGGVLVKNQTFYVFEGNGYTVEMTYTFDENGKIVG